MANCKYLNNQHHNYCYQQKYLSMMFTDITPIEIEVVMEQAALAAATFKKTSVTQRANLLREIAKTIKACGDVLLELASTETNLPVERLRIERDRTVFQLESYADYCASGQALHVRIDKLEGKKDIRKTMVPLGPVVVFGASNFPFAYSTAGGDTACALAAGCSVIVKAHPAHAQTSQMVADAISLAVANLALPKAIFTHVHGADNAIGEALVKHPQTKAVAFTGSLAGGKQLFDWGVARDIPIPVFCEMGSVNPVFLLPEKIAESASTLADLLGASMTESAGQFCTNPGILVAIKNQQLDAFTTALGAYLKKALPAPMLTPGIYKSFVEKRATALSQPEVSLLAVSSTDAMFNEGSPTLAITTANNFITNNLLQQEVFGPYCILVTCADLAEMQAVANQMAGQLTATVMGTEQELAHNAELINVISNCCGRLIFNDVPTGVQVGLAMHHGGPYPATTDSRFTAVGADGIARFLRPMAYQNCPEILLPAELKNDNPLGIWRTVNNEPGKI